MDGSIQKESAQLASRFTKAGVGAVSGRGSGSNEYLRSSGETIACLAGIRSPSKGAWASIAGSLKKEAGHWFRVSHTLKRGDQGNAVNLLRKSLERQGDFASRAPDTGPLFDESLADAVRAFEARNGLPVDGVADAEMLSVLNTPVETVIRQIELNLERLRWLPDDLGKRHLLVNIPDYRLQLVEDGQTVLQMRVVVGKKENPTPVFSDQMTYLTFNPFWNIPESIAIKETVPTLAQRRWLRRETRNSGGHEGKQRRDRGCF